MLAAFEAAVGNFRAHVLHKGDLYDDYDSQQYLMGVVDNDLDQFASVIRRWATIKFDASVPPPSFVAFTDPPIPISEFRGVRQLVTTGSVK